MSTVTTPDHAPTPASIAPRARGPVHADAAQPWGRVDEHGAVFVRDGEAERQVGEYPDAPVAEALAYYERKYSDLAAQVGLLEQRARGGAPTADIARAVGRLQEVLLHPAAVGDLQALRSRVAALGGTVEQLTAQQNEAHQAEVTAARAERETIVVEAETMAARDPASVQWKATTAAMDALFERWQQSQRSTARIPKGEANDLWRRFRAARSTVDTQRRAFFAELDSTQKGAREVKERLVERAEGLQHAPNDPIGAYRQLLEEWKQAGRAGRKADDALWARFRAAGDALYAAKSAAQSTQDAEYGENLAVKQALLTEAEALLTSTDAAAARSTLIGVQRRWDAAGRVPREQTRTVDDRLRRVEQHVKTLEQEHWRRSNPETKARSEGLATQLNAAIERLETDLAAARTAGDRRATKDAEDALAARRIWLDALGG